MLSKKTIILLTGQPAIGKTTIIKGIVKLLSNKAGGFFSREIRISGNRVGFEIVTLEGKIDCLAIKSLEKRFDNEQIFKDYRVNLNAINSIAVPALLKALDEGNIIIADEIGPMEVLSEAFCDAILSILNNDKAIVVGTIADNLDCFIQKVKSHDRVLLRRVTLENRNILLSRIYSEINQYLHQMIRQNITLR